MPRWPLYLFLVTVAGHVKGGGWGRVKEKGMDVLSAYFLDQGHVRAFIMRTKLLRRGSRLAVDEDEYRVSHGASGFKVKENRIVADFCFIGDLWSACGVPGERAARSRILVLLLRQSG